MGRGGRHRAEVEGNEPEVPNEWTAAVAVETSRRFAVTRGAWCRGGMSTEEEVVVGTVDAGAADTGTNVTGVLTVVSGTTSEPRDGVLGAGAASPARSQRPRNDEGSMARSSAGVTRETFCFCDDAVVQGCKIL